MYGLTLQTAPTAALVNAFVTPEDARRACGVAAEDDSRQQDFIDWIAAAIDYCERWTNRAFLTSTWDLQLDFFPCGNEPILLPRAPLASITSIAYLQASDGVSTTWSSSEYRVITSTEPGQVVPAWNYFYPAIRTITGAVTVRFVAGSAAASVPAPLKRAVLTKVKELYLLDVEGDAKGYPEVCASLLQSYRVADDFLRYEREAVYA